MISPTTPPDEEKQAELNDLFSQFSPFQVPAYQRAYAWDKEHIDQFVEDLSEHPHDKPYYLGHFLLERPSDGHVFVIDGQQRLTTLVLAFGCMSRQLSTLPEHQAFADDLKHRFLGAPLEMRFQTVNDDQSLLEGLVFNGDSKATNRSRSHERLIEANKRLQQSFAKVESEQLLKWAGSLMRAQVTSFVVKDKVQATQIFTFQNSRGKKLTDFEKLKAFLMHQIYLHAEEKLANIVISRVEGHFADMYRKMEEIHLLDENGVLRHHDQAYSSHGENGAVENLKKDLSTIPEKKDKVHFISRFCEGLAATFGHVHEIEKLAKTEERVADPLILSPGTAWPLIIKLYAFFQQSMLSRSDVRDLLRHVEIALFKMNFQHGKVTNDLVYRTKRLQTETDLPQICERMKFAVHRGFAHNRWTFDSDALAWFQWDQCYDPISRYVLWKYENNLSLDNDRKVTPGDYLNLAGKNNMQSTLEHVSARNPREGNNTEEFKSKYLNSIGNLAFMPKGMNSTLSNRPESEKQPMMQNSNYAAHREIAGMMAACGEWTPETILSRKDKILTFILERWEIPAPRLVEDQVEETTIQG
jgi:hypothetical protein